MTMYALFALLPLPLLLLAAAATLRRRPARPVELYVRPVLEQDFGVLFARLRLALPQYVILGPVSLASFVQTKSLGGAGVAAARAELARHTVDFLICGADYRIVAAVELEDILHGRRADGQRSRLLRQARVPLLRWNTVNLPTLRDIQEAVAELETLRLIHSARHAPARSNPISATNDRRRAPRS